MKWPEKSVQGDVAAFQLIVAEMRRNGDESAPREYLDDPMGLERHAAGSQCGCLKGTEARVIYYLTEGL